MAADFFTKETTPDFDQVFPVLVMGTVSSGKSTLINALLGQQILPGRNEACTAKAFYILNDDSAEHTRLYITYANGKTIVREENIASAIEWANKDKRVTDVFLRGPVKDVRNRDKALLIVDTPGPNNARDMSHGGILEDTLSRITEGLTVYVINAAYRGTCDDRDLLKQLHASLKQHPKMKVLFVINQADKLDAERESIEGMVLETVDYLKENGFHRPNLIPTSALAACMFQKALDEKRMSRKERLDFVSRYALYKPCSYALKSYAVTKDLPDQFEQVTAAGVKYRVGELMQAIENTGIGLVEDYIRKA